MDRDDFQRASEAIEDLLCGLGDPDRARLDLYTLAILGRDARLLFVDVEGDILRTGGAPEPVVSRPWKSDPSNKLAFATAHDVAGVLVEVISGEVIEDHPEFRDLVEDVSAWVQEHEAELADRLAKIEAQIEYGEILALIARIRRERLLLLADWKELVVPTEAAGDLQYVTRDQLALLCNRHKDTVRRWFDDDPDAPPPAIEGGGGKAHEYQWDVRMRTWLAEKSGRQMPERFPRLI